uniref:ATP-dependent RNA helicase PRP5/DDX46/KHDC4 KH domain-containing protein n=1 Tax=Pygocentrus nattereri TaxID=42514 RepID=A0AAR2JXA5_PYGNA
MLQGILGSVSHPRSSHVASAPVDTTSAGPAVGPPGSAVPGHNPPQGGVEMAAAMAAKINAMLMAKGKLKPLQPLPSKVRTAPLSTEEVVVTEVDINDVPVNCRNLLTKGKTQEEVSVPECARAPPRVRACPSPSARVPLPEERPLYLHVQGRTQEEVNSTCTS